MPRTLGGLPVPNRRKVGTTSSHHGPHVQGHTRATMGRTEGCESVSWSQSRKAALSSDWRLQPASMKPESLVIVDQPRHGEYVPGPCTHRPSRQGSPERPKSVPELGLKTEAKRPKASRVTGAKS